MICRIAKIIEYAPRWLQKTCENENDWGEDEQSPLTESQSVVTDETENSISIDDNSPQIFVQSAMGVEINATETEAVFPIDNISRLNIKGQEGYLGHLSWFLKRAIRQLKEKHELRRTPVDRIIVTKHELYFNHPNSMLIRKIYITPSTLLYEGPYHEEKCFVTRRFTHVQDGFLRVCFRDEG